MNDKEDLYIKEKLQQDKVISEKANEKINEILMEVSEMAENNNEELNKVQNQENKSENTNKDTNKVSKKSKLSWQKKTLAIAASLVIIFGAANVYAHTQGYDNIFFMIKTLVSGEKVEGKENILSDRDISISYESIKITDNISIQIKNLKIKDNKAKLTVLVKEKEFEKDENIVPLRYKVYNSLDILMCKQKSIKTEDKNLSSYTEELELSNYNEGEKILKLEILKANAEVAATLNINLQEKTVEVIGEAEALSKISETELKEFLSHAAMISKPLGQRTKEDNLIASAIALGIKYDKISQESINNGSYLANAYKVKDINKIISTVFNQKIESLNNLTLFVKKVKNGEEYYVFKEITDENFAGECINVVDISFASGIYTVQYNYFYPGSEPEEDRNMDNYNIYQQTINIALNDDTEFCKFKIVSIEEYSVIKSSKVNTEDNQTPTIPDDSINTNNTTNSNNTNIPATNSTTNNSAENTKPEDKVEDTKILRLFVGNKSDMKGLDNIEVELFTSYKRKERNSLY